MKSSNDLSRMLGEIDKKGYPAYKSLAGAYDLGTYVFVIDHVQGDPFASPSSVHVEISLTKAGFPEDWYKKDCKKIALQDYLTRQFAGQIEGYNFKAKGSGKSGLISITRCGQEVLERSACQIKDGKIISRFHIGFPAFGRTIDGKGLSKILFEYLPKCIENSFFYKKINQKKAEEAVLLAEDQMVLRKILKKENLAAFVANGSVLPRKSGISDLPMKGSVIFKAPPSMERTFVLPYYGEISGMAIPQGITLIVGGGYHGKSTLLSALQMGVYNHIKGDGREFVITDSTGVKLRAEEGRFIRNRDISMFIHNLPNKKNENDFSTEDASGSTSQAAGVVEAMEAGCRLFLMDEDTSATNFMVRDELMQRIVSREKEPITPFLERALELYKKAGISTILAAGSSGAFFYIADKILQMDCYRPVDITKQVKKICAGYKAPRVQSPGYKIPAPQPSWNKKKGGRDYRKVKAMGRDGVSIDREMVDLRYVEQLTDEEQTLALGYLLRYALDKLESEEMNTKEAAEMLWELLEKKGWEPFCASYIPCGLAKPRKQEIFACLNRYRG